MTLWFGTVLPAVRSTTCAGQWHLRAEVYCECVAVPFWSPPCFLVGELGSTALALEGTFTQKSSGRQNRNSSVQIPSACMLFFTKHVQSSRPRCFMKPVESSFPHYVGSAPACCLLPPSLRHFECVVVPFWSRPFSFVVGVRGSTALALGRHSAHRKLLGRQKGEQRITDS